jgi:hypothetical protein
VSQSEFCRLRFAKAYCFEEILLAFVYGKLLGAKLVLLDEIQKQDQCLVSNKNHFQALVV